MEEIYLVDYLGIHCGMHYYNDAFKKIITNNGTKRVKILSNYSDSEENPPFFVNQYKGSLINKGISLLRNLWRLRSFIKHHPDSVYVYLTYGNSIDLPFMRIIAKANRHIIDIHEAIAQHVDVNNKLKEKFKHLYKNHIKAVISHSTRTDEFLREYHYYATKLFVPHFKYIFPKAYDQSKISDDIYSAPDKDRINLLFFGNLNESKGVDILLEAVNLLQSDTIDKMNIVIAGKDFDGAIDRVIPRHDCKVKIIRRHITDDELRYLYQNVDYMALPYRKTSQSGILEMSFYFKKPIIASDIPYFRNTLAEFPSFGILAGNTAESYAETLDKVIKGHGHVQYYDPYEYDKYENRDEIKLFVSAFNNWLNIT